MAWFSWICLVSPTQELSYARPIWRTRPWRDYARTTSHCQWFPLLHSTPIKTISRLRVTFLTSKIKMPRIQFINPLIWDRDSTCTLESNLESLRFSVVRWFARHLPSSSHSQRTSQTGRLTWPLWCSVRPYLPATSSTMLTPIRPLSFLKRTTGYSFTERMIQDLLSINSKEENSSPLATLRMKSLAFNFSKRPALSSSCKTTSTPLTAREDP